MALKGRSKHSRRGPDDNKGHRSSNDHGPEMIPHKSGIDLQKS